MNDPQQIRSAIRTCIDFHLQDFVDAPLSICQTELERCERVGRAVADGEPLDEETVLFLLGLISSFINHLTYQSIHQWAEPQLPLSDLPRRLGSAAAILEAVTPLLASRPAEVERSKMAIERAKRLHFRWSHGAPFDFDVVRAERDLGKGTVVRAPVARALCVPFGPTSWNRSMGPARPGRILIRLGQHDPATVLLLVEQDRPHGVRAINVFALRDEERVLLRRIEDQAMWYCDGLDRSLGNEALRGTHFSLWTPPAMFMVYLADLGSPLGVYVEVPQTQG
jgi:hypothetical protein